MFRSHVVLGGGEPTASRVRGTGDYTLHLIGKVTDVIDRSALLPAVCEPSGSKGGSQGTLAKLHGEKGA